jgi:excisionase family DNA binding protein
VKPDVAMAQMRRLPVVLDPVTAGRLLGIGRTSVYRLLEAGEFPAPAFKVGRQWRIPTSGLCRLLGMDPALMHGDDPVRPSSTDPQG